MTVAEGVSRVSPVSLSLQPRNDDSLVGAPVQCPGRAINEPERETYGSLEVNAEICADVDDAAHVDHAEIDGLFHWTPEQ